VTRPFPIASSRGDNPPRGGRREARANGPLVHPLGRNRRITADHRMKHKGPERADTGGAVSPTRATSKAERTTNVIVDPEVLID
jgi:hypothetical protein